MPTPAVSTGRLKPTAVFGPPPPWADTRAQKPQAAVYFGDAHAQVYAVDVQTGAMRWKVKVDDHGDAMITGAPALHDGRLYVPVSSLEEGSGAMPAYECCTFVGSVVVLDAADGR